MNKTICLNAMVAAYSDLPWSCRMGSLYTGPAFFLKSPKCKNIFGGANFQKGENIS